jgi:hypothetical protein
MEHLTGVRISRDLLADASFRCAAVPDLPKLAWMRANPDRIGPWTVEELAVRARSRLAATAQPTLAVGVLCRKLNPHSSPSREILRDRTHRPHAQGELLYNV